MKAAAKNIQQAAEGQLIKVPLNKLFTFRNTRKDFDKKEIEEMAESIKRVGLINAITVRYRNLIEGCTTDPDNLTFDIVAGHKRAEACKLAGLNEIDAQLKDITDDQLQEIQLVENLQRSDMHPIDEAGGFYYLIITGKYDVKALSEKIGKSEKYILGRLDLINLTNDIMVSFRKNEILIGHANRLCHLQPEFQKKAFKWLFIF